MTTGVVRTPEDRSPVRCPSAEALVGVENLLQNLRAADGTGFEHEGVWS